MQRLCSAATSHTGRSAPNRLNFLFYVRQGRLFNLPLARGAAVEVGHNLPVGVPLASRGVSRRIAARIPGESRNAGRHQGMAGRRCAHRRRLPSGIVAGPTPGISSAAVPMVARWSRVAIPAVRRRRLQRVGATARRRRIEATNQVHLRPDLHLPMVARWEVSDDARQRQPRRRLARAQVRVKRGARRIAVRSDTSRSSRSATRWRSSRTRARTCTIRSMPFAAAVRLYTAPVGRCRLRQSRGPR